MNNNGQLWHSVYLESDKCLGCTTCLRSCPTGAIRVRQGKAQIIESKCIDCGECIRICPHQAKMALTNVLSDIKEYPYKVCIPAPTLLGQFKNTYSIEAILSAIKRIGFDEVVEVAFGAEVVGRALKYEFKTKDYPKPMISSACPAVSKLIQVRFPELTDNISALKSPMEITAALTRKRLVQNEHMRDEDIGIFFITPCAAKATEVNATSAVNGAISVKDIYRPVIRELKSNEFEKGIHNSTAAGFGWAISGGESKYLTNKRILHVDGISNVSAVLEGIECGKLQGIEFLEGLACTGGCVGGCLTLENNYIAKMNIEERAKIDVMESSRHLDEAYVKHLYTSGQMGHKKALKPRKQSPLDEDVKKAIEKMNQMEIIEKRLPGLDCGSCGSPGCRALAEDIVTGKAREIDCIFVLKDKIKELSMLTSDLLQGGHPMNIQIEKSEDENEG